MKSFEHLRAMYFVAISGRHEAMQYEMAIKKYGSVEEAYNLSDAKALKEKADRDIDEALKRNINIIGIDDPDYPVLLREYAWHPLVLFYRGDIKRLSTFENNLGIVGSRNCTIQGRDITRELVSGLSGRNISIISGMARGIDGEAHKAALRNNLFTCAVLAGSVDYIYPAENKAIYNALLEKGVILSEQPPGDYPKKQYFPARNRIIAGLSNAVLLTEAGQRSGALITCDFALDAGRDVLTVPQSVDSVYGIGCNEMLKKGAACITCSEDILLAMGYDVENCVEKCIDLSELNDIQKRVYNVVAAKRGLTEDEIIKQSLLNVNVVKQALAFLELFGYVRRREDGAYLGILKQK